MPPNESITREQLAAILYRYALYKEYDVSQGGMIIREFDDYHEISEYAFRSLTRALNSGIISGKEMLCLTRREVQQEPRWHLC